MIDDTAMTKNIKRFLAAIRELQDRSVVTEGMGLLWGQPGEGKTTAISFVVNQMDGIYLRAMRYWTETSMLGALMTELGMESMGRKAPMMHAILERLMEYPKPVFVDEADYLFKNTHMLDSLRDIYDMTGSPVILIGMEKMARKIQVRGKFARRITQWIEFTGIDLADSRVVADTLCEVDVANDLLAHVNKAAKANIGRMLIGLSRIEQFARTNKLETVTLSDWGNRRLFYDQPKFGRRNR